MVIGIAVIERSKASRSLEIPLASPSLEKSLASLSLKKSLASPSLERSLKGLHFDNIGNRAVLKIKDGGSPGHADTKTR